TNDQLKDKKFELRFELSVTVLSSSYKLFLKAQNFHFKNYVHIFLIIKQMKEIRNYLINNCNIINNKSRTSPCFEQIKIIVNNAYNRKILDNN
ncbi:hypothetical protein BpHYR1_028695, partial [Brachionus plicatilis]